jgi:aryl-alcohol dehydrogenase-like predicted oxidoreductase
MKHISLGGLEVSRIGLGAMTMAGTYTTGGTLDNAESIRTIHRALELGVTHIDTAEIYGPVPQRRDRRPSRSRDAATRSRSPRSSVSSPTATGGPGVIDSSPPTSGPRSKGSLTRLGTDHIDLYYQHRVDPRTRRSKRQPAPSRT